MKHLFTLILTLLVAVANASERVTLTCELDAIASGYVDKSYSANLILQGDRLYNQDGSTGSFQRKAIYGDGSSAYQFYIYDGSEFRGLYSSNMKIGKIIEWSLNVGTVACVMTKGWDSEKYTDNKTVVYVHDTVVKIDRTPPSWASCASVMPHYTDTIKTTKYDTVYAKYSIDTVVVHDTVIKIVKDSILDSSKATQRFSLRGKYVGLAVNEIDCEFYTHFLKYNDTVFNEQGEYVDSFEIKLLYTSGSYYKTIKLERNTLISLMGHPAIYPTRKGNFYITTERNWNEESIKDWSKVKPSATLQKEVDRLRAELDRK
jgi:hypothetical protein